MCGKKLLPYNPAVVLNGIFPNEFKTYVRTWMFIAALLLIVKTWKQVNGK